MISDNPNAARPVLSIGRKPLALDAYKAKLKLPPEPPPFEIKAVRTPVLHPGVKPESAHVRAGCFVADVHTPNSYLGNEFGDVQIGEGDIRDKVHEAPTKPVRPPLPFIEIPGAVYEGSPSYTDPAGRKAALGK